MTRTTMETCDFRNKLESAPCETGAPYPQGEKKNFPGEKKKKTIRNADSVHTEVVVETGGKTRVGRKVGTTEKKRKTIMISDLMGYRA